MSRIWSFLKRSSLSRIDEGGIFKSLDAECLPKISWPGSKVTIVCPRPVVTGIEMTLWVALSKHQAKTLKRYTSWNTASSIVFRQSLIYPRVTVDTPEDLQSASAEERWFALRGGDLTWSDLFCRLTRPSTRRCSLSKGRLWTIERIRFWRSGCSGYAFPISPLVLRSFQPIFKINNLVQDPPSHLHERWPIFSTPQ